jgi:16S rRNA (uracil1498-N3)-methyltransferase
MDISPKVRLFVEHPLAAGAPVTLTPEQGHYLRNVMRIDIGARVAMFNGRDGEWTGRLTDLGKRGGQATLERRLREQRPEPDLWLLFAPVKRQRIDTIVEKAAELGVSQLFPVFTRHTVMTRVNDGRLQAIATEAAEQCERLSVPPVHPPVSLEERLTGWPEGRRLVLLDEGGGGRPVAEALAEIGTGPAAVLVGPEGGFAKSELDALRRLSFACPVGLGPRILRADTAVIAALSCFQAICGDWRTTPNARS